MDTWTTGAIYERYVGRWSRPVAERFLDWLGVRGGGAFLDVGCGTGALTQTILDHAAPQRIVGVDSSEGFIAHARETVRDPRIEFRVGDARALPIDDAAFDAVVSGLVLNFVPSPEQALAEMCRAARPRGAVAVYVWDYAEGMELMRAFWDAAVALDPEARALDEGKRFPLCRPEPLEVLFRGAGLDDVVVRPIDVPTVFRDFDDYWSPFLGGQGPAPGYCVSLDEDRRLALRERLRAKLPVAADGSIRLSARAWAARGTVPK
jgi:SAM-dependent methyltransferase